MFCSKCGEKNDEGAMFCFKCGTKVGSVSAEIKKEGIDNQLTQPGIEKNKFETKDLKVKKGKLNDKNKLILSLAILIFTLLSHDILDIFMDSDTLPEFVNYLLMFAFFASICYAGFRLIKFISKRAENSKMLQELGVIACYVLVIAIALFAFVMPAIGDAHSRFLARQTISLEQELEQVLMDSITGRIRDPEAAGMVLGTKIGMHENRVNNLSERRREVYEEELARLRGK